MPAERTWSAGPAGGGGLTAAALVACVLAGLWGFAGCSDDYEHERLTGDSPEAKKVKAMLADLRKAGEAGLDGILARDAAPGLDEAKAKMLRGTLRELAVAKSVEFDRMDRFGKDVWRVTFRVTDQADEASEGPTPREVSVLLVLPDEGKPLWAGRN